MLSTGGPAPGAIYPTSDNDGWYSPLISAPAQWRAQSSLGDANWTLSDVAAPRHALILRSRVTAETANDIVPPLRAVTFLNDMSVDGPGTAQFIQTLAGEVWVDGQLDAVALTLLPLQYVVTHADKTKDTLSVDGALGDVSAGRKVLIRNKNWGAATDVNLAHAAGWSLLDTVPTGTLRFWVSGGHALPRYYAYAEQAGVGRLYRYERTVVGSGAHWDELNVQGGRTDPMPHPQSGIVKNTWKGPVFVNPYRQDEIYVLTETGVRVSEDGGDHFTADAPLTSFVTAGGRYSLSSAFGGGDGTGVHFANRSNLNAMGALSDMAFERSNPDDVAAVSPFSGLAYRAHGTWLDMMPFTGSTIAPMSSVAIDPDMIVVATEGRGIFRLLAYHQALNFPPTRVVRGHPPSP